MFERCGVSKEDVIKLAGMSQRQAALKCGISYDHFNQTLIKYNLTHLFNRSNRPSQVNHSQTMVFIKEDISIEDVRQCHGLLMKDAAAELGISESCFSRKIQNYFPELRGLFPAKGGEAQYIARRGYTHEATQFR